MPEPIYNTQLEELILQLALKNEEIKQLEPKNETPEPAFIAAPSFASSELWRLLWQSSTSPVELARTGKYQDAIAALERWCRTETSMQPSSRAFITPGYALGEYTKARDRFDAVGSRESKCRARQTGCRADQSHSWELRSGVAPISMPY